MEAKGDGQGTGNPQWFPQEGIKELAGPAAVVFTHFVCFFSLAMEKLEAQTPGQRGSIKSLVLVGCKLVPATWQAGASSQTIHFQGPP